MNHRLLNIAPPSAELPRDVLDAPGGFAWWYADIVNDHGDGVVLIWSYGLPFLPGYMAAARAGRPSIPRSRPSLNVSILRDGRLDFYLLQEIPAHDATWDEGRWQFGESIITSRRVGDEWQLDAELRCEIPSSVDRFEAALSLRGPARATQSPGDWLGAHDWSPLTATATGELSGHAEGRRWRVEGRAYHDCNAGRGTLEDAGIATWAWGRIVHAAADHIYYVVWHHDGDVAAHCVRLERDGDVVAASAKLLDAQYARGRAGLSYPRRICLDVDGESVDVTATTLVDDGPFYVRHFIRDEAGVRGLGEFCRTDRIDLLRHRPLVRMRVHQLQGDNSIWLPLFSGPRTGRVRRLLSQWRR